MELRIGDYVRSDRGIIAKITNINKTGSIICDRNIYYGFNVVSNKRVLCDLSKIIKSSPNIIDLIEVGDYVDSCPVYCINYDLDKEEDIVESITISNSFQKATDILYEKDIKSIVTKEQFESMEYKVKE